MAERRAEDRPVTMLLNCGTGFDAPEVAETKGGQAVLSLRRGGTGFGVTECVKDRREAVVAA